MATVSKSMIVVVWTVCAIVSASQSNNMNERSYSIANPNPNSPKPFSGDYSEYMPESKYFDVYSPMISTRYGQVYWDRMDPTPLPRDIVKQFDGKVMAITGYESDQVQRTPNGDVPLPITAAYNHHYTGYVVSNNADYQKVSGDAATMGHPSSDGEYYNYIDTRPVSERTGPASCALHEGNGGEYRLSFHGYPQNFAQLIESPTQFVMNPMQIDTWNRDNKNFSGFWPGPEPMQSERLPGAPYSGLLECPCTTRITKSVNSAMVARVKGQCTAEVEQASSCDQAQLSKLNIPGLHNLKVKSVVGSNASMPRGCSLTMNWDASTGQPESNAIAFFNTDNTTTTPCGSQQGNPTHMFAAANPTMTNVNIGVWLEFTDSTMRVTMTGPSDVWFGVGLNTTTMAEGTYAIVVLGNGSITERDLGNHQPGSQLPSTLKVEKNALNHNGKRTVVVSRPITSTESFKFSLTDLKTTPVLPLIAAYGTSGIFGYHKAKSALQVTVVNLDSPTCFCETTREPFGKGTGFLNYVPPAGEPGSPQSKIPGAGPTQLSFSKNCLPYPESTMLLGKNPSCDLRSYTGGQSCCHHLVTLLDENQTTPWVDEPLEYYMKFRIYYQENPAIANLVQHNWGGMATPVEYDVPKCGEGVFGCSFENGEWVHRMNGTWTVAQMTGGISFEPVVIHGHCHAPTCLDFTLFNADTNEVICKQTPTFGATNATFDEKGYMFVPPCVFGEPADGFMPSLNISADTRLFSSKTCKANTGHHGEMSLWQTYCKH